MTSTFKITIQFLDSSEEVFEYPTSLIVPVYQQLVEDIEERLGIYDLTFIDSEDGEVENISHQTATFTCIIDKPKCRSCGDEDIEIIKNGYCKECYIEHICGTCFTTETPRLYRDYIMCASTYEERWRYRVFFDNDYGEQEEVIIIDADGTEHSCDDDRLLSGEYDRLVLSSDIPDEIRDEFCEITIEPVGL